MPTAAAAFHIAANGKTTGPFDLGALTQQAESGQFTRDSMVWKAGMTDWGAAGQIPELTTVFGPPPPSLPSGGQPAA